MKCHKSRFKPFLIQIIDLEPPFVVKIVDFWSVLALFGPELKVYVSSEWCKWMEIVKIFSRDVRSAIKVDSNHF